MGGGIETHNECWCYILPRKYHSNQVTLAGIESCHILPYYHLLGGRERGRDTDIL
jgi:hypothetical protein